MGEGEGEMAKVRTKPIVRLGIFLISHSSFFSVICLIAAVVALLLLPVLAKNTYISENALMPGSANNMLSTQDASEANKLVNDLTHLGLRSPIESQKIVGQYMSGLDAEVTYHKFYPQLNRFHPLHFFTSPDSGISSKTLNCSSPAINTVGIIRAPRGDGKETIVLVTPYNPVKNDVGEALSLGIAYSVFSLLSRVTWLAKDIVWLVADSRYGEYSAVDAWLTEYHNPVYGVDMKFYSGFRRAGTMAAALVIKVAEDGNHIEDSLNIYAEASNGQMPNLDLINIVNYLAVHKQGLRIKVKKIWSLLGLRWLNTLGVIFESVGQIARSLNPQWKFGIPASEYVEGTATLASSLYYQGLGVPTGPHGAFRDYQVDAITLEISPKVSLTKSIRRNDFILRGGRLIEGVVLSINNFLEKFHQSFFLYLLTSPSKFVSIGVYMIPFALLVAPLPLVAASLHADTSKSTTPQTTGVDVSRKSWKWLNSAQKKREWVSLKSVTITAAFMGLSLMSVINFATAQISALFIVPICLMARPLKLDALARSLGTLLRASFNLVLGFIAFPPVAYVLLKVAFDDVDGFNAGEYWNWLESLWTWNSATYLYVGIVHLPCWALCIHILFHPC
ncbi:hypothetical protein TanjilG_13406 [Lupinus angustifolius]|uniref:Glycosylphosphatidylinositol anchor attachment 1 protein n=1 Tax=Lupinus angustifolius TaxID=3871 RepID=A0A4P1RUP3_LUPAN|nr:hypothetical protein TanjilG_13406 [Lupinus angustifolius]